MRVLVLGAGVVGVATAYYLAKTGHAVTVVDRQPGPALETSFANGGQISTNHAAPWATPQAPWQALKWLGREDAPLLFRPRLDPALWSWSLRFLANCRHERMRVNTDRALRLATYGREQLGALRAEIGIEYHALTRGILSVFRNPQAYDETLPAIRWMEELGVRVAVLSPSEAIALEPALATAHNQLVAAVHFPEDESGDAHEFTARLAEHCAGLGVTFRYGVRVTGLADDDGTRIWAAATDAGSLEADAFVIALGSFSPLVLKRLGLRLPVYPCKGYSVSIPVENPERAPTVSVTDEEAKMVYSRLGNVLRAAGTAEFAGYDTDVTEKRARSLLRKALDLFPGCGNEANATLWAGLRPMSPDGVPIIGRARHDNLYLNTGHGTLGWTMACGSGRIIADLIGGRQPDIRVDDLGIDRFA